MRHFLGNTTSDGYQGKSTDTEESNMGKHGKIEQSGTGKRRCPAMIEAGIENPDSQEGIDFCLDCPYPDCIAFSGDGKIQSVRWLVAKKLHNEGHNIEQIAELLNIKEQTAKQYISRKIK